MRKKNKAQPKYNSMIILFIFIKISFNKKLVKLAYRKKYVDNLYTQYIKYFLHKINCFNINIVKTVNT